jgi:hypothetical protein
MIDEVRTTGRALGHAQACHDAASILWRMADRADSNSDKKTRDELHRARWLILRLAIGDIKEHDKGKPLDVETVDNPLDTKSARKGGAR